jgi:hypothetical protein
VKASKFHHSFDLAIYIILMFGFDFNVICNMCRCSSIIGGRTFFTISSITHHGCIWHGLSTILVGSIVQGKLCSLSCGNERKIWIFQATICGQV